jgi:hypothetical protein
MKQILPELKEINSYLSFAKIGWSKRGFRHIQIYVSGLITLNKKTIRQISQASIKENHHSRIHDILQYAKFEKEKLEKRYLKKIKYVCKGFKVYLIFDDTLDYREGKKIEEIQSHKDHCSNKFVNGHQYFTSMISFGNLELPLFPKLYSKNTKTKIEMAYDLIDSMSNFIKINSVICDSWYSDKKIMKLCRKRNIRIVCGIKTNRKIKFSLRGEYSKLSEFTKIIYPEKFYYIDESLYKINDFKIHLNKFYSVKMLISNEYLKNDIWSSNFHIISSINTDSVVKIIRIYHKRWVIETFHRDIKQNLGFGKCQMRRLRGIVCHSILVSLAYTCLRLFMYHKKLDMTIGECISYIQENEMNNFVKEIVEIEDKNERILFFKEVFIRKTAKV